MSRLKKGPHTRRHTHSDHCQTARLGTTAQKRKLAFRVKILLSLIESILRVQLKLRKVQHIQSSGPRIWQVRRGQAGKSRPPNVTLISNPECCHRLKCHKAFFVRACVLLADMCLLLYLISQLPILQKRGGGASQPKCPLEKSTKISTRKPQLLLNIGTQEVADIDECSRGRWETRQFLKWFELHFRTKKSVDTRQWN